MCRESGEATLTAQESNALQVLLQHNFTLIGYPYKNYAREFEIVAHGSAVRCAHSLWLSAAPAFIFL